jgi:hypothetical protein
MRRTAAGATMSEMARIGPQRALSARRPDSAGRQTPMVRMRPMMHVTRVMPKPMTHSCLSRGPEQTNRKSNRPRQQRYNFQRSTLADNTGRELVKTKYCRNDTESWQAGYRDSTKA